MQLDIINSKGEKTGRTAELPEEIFGIEPNDHVIYLAVKQYRGAQRQGTHKVKTRSEVKGSSKKLHKQKVQVGHVKEILEVRFIKVVVAFLAQRRINMISSLTVRLKILLK
jgi:Ribosomal protein L4/L1 family